MKENSGGGSQRVWGRAWAGRCRHLLSFRAALSALGGLAVVLSFAPVDWSPLVWLGPPLFLVAIEGRSWRARALLGFIHGLVIQGGGFYWIAYAGAAFGQFLVFKELGGDPIWWLGALVFVAWWLSSSLFWMLWGILLTPRGPAGWRWWWPVLTLVALEAWFPRVFPWRLGDGAHGWPAMAQAARCFGVEGVSALIVLVGVLLHGAWRNRRAGADRRRRAGACLAVALGVMVVWCGAGYVRLAGDGESAQTLRVGYVQPNISLAVRHGRGDPNDIVRSLRRGTRAVLEEQPDVVVWSEGIFPRFQHSERSGDSMSRAKDFERFATDLPPGLVFGLLGPSGENRAIFVGPVVNGRRRQLAQYDKRFLLAFGERFPLRGFLQTIGFNIPEDFPAGDTAEVWDIAGVPTGISICFEGLLPEAAPELVAAGARAQLNITEDKWFGPHSEPHQHLALTAMRVVEADLPMVRVTNGGISAWIDRFGRVRQATPVDTAQNGVFPVAVAAQVEPAPLSQRGHRILPWLALVLVVLRVAHAWRARGTAQAAAARPE